MLIANLKTQPLVTVREHQIRCIIFFSSHSRTSSVTLVLRLCLLSYQIWHDGLGVDDALSMLFFFPVCCSSCDGYVMIGCTLFNSMCMRSRLRKVPSQEKHNVTAIIVSATTASVCVFVSSRTPRMMMVDSESEVKTNLIFWSSSD